MTQRCQQWTGRRICENPATVQIVGPFSTSLACDSCAAFATRKDARGVPVNNVRVKPLRGNT